MIEFPQSQDELVLKCVPFDQLDRYRLYDLLALRIAVFCVEQNCPYLDTDGKDQNAWHVLCYQQGELVGTCRILMPEDAYAGACSIGRVANAASARGMGVGKRMMQFAVERCDLMFADFPVRISAQKYLLSFYKQFGFEACSEPYLEDGIVHVAMIRR